MNPARDNILIVTRDDGRAFMLCYGSIGDLGDGVDIEDLPSLPALAAYEAEEPNQRAKAGYWRPGNRTPV